MGGEWFHFVTFKRDALKTTADDLEYEKVFVLLVKTASDWWTKKMKTSEEKEWSEWTFEASVLSGILVKSPPHKHDFFDNPICIPLVLDSTFNVGWQHRRYGSCLDPKFELAEQLIQILKQHLTADMMKRIFHDYEMFEEHEIFPYRKIYTRQRSFSEDQRDFTACSSDCVYCGNCDY